MRKPSTIGAAICAATLPLIVSAATPEDDAGTVTLSPMVVSASRTTDAADQLASSVTVIEGDTLSLMGAHTVLEALRQVPALQVTMNGGPGTTSGVFIRGTETRHTLVLIDGVRVNSNTTGGFDLGTIPVSIVERIEVLRGPQGAMYGSDAIGGVISIITRKGGAAKMVGGDVRLEAGEKGLIDGSVAVAGGNDRVDYRLGASYYEMTGHNISRESAGNTENDTHERMSLSGAIGGAFLEDGRADLTVMFQDEKTELDGGWGLSEDDPDRYTESEKLFTAFKASKPVNDWYTQHLTLAYNEQQFDGFDNGMQEYSYNTENTEAGLQGDFVTVEDHSLSAGYTYLEQRAENDGNYSGQKLSNHGLFVEDLWTMTEDLFVNMGLRYDDWSEFDGRATYRLGASWQAAELTRLYTTLGTGYKVPTLNDLYWPTSDWSSGNPDLKAEKSQNVDLGLEQSAANGRVSGRITGFYNEIDDMITWADGGVGVWLPQNVDQAEIAGVECSAVAQPIDSLLLTADYTYTDAKDKATDNQLVRRSKHLGGIGVRWQCVSTVALSADARYVGSSYDDAANTEKLSSYTVVNIGGEWAVTDSAELFANVNNLFDENYESALGYQSLGRVASAGAKVRF